MKKSRVRDPKPGFLVGQFTIFFAGSAAVPLVLLFYLYSQYRADSGLLSVTRDELWLITFIVGACSLAGYFLMRGTLSQITRLAQNMKKSLLGKIDRELLLELVRGDGEVAELARSFGQVFNRLEDNIKELEQTKSTLHEVLSKVARALATDENYDELVKLILETAIDAIGAWQGAVFSIDDGGAAKLRATVGNDGASEEKLLRTAAPYLEWVRKECRAIVLPSLEAGLHEHLFNAPMICAPLLYHDRIMGAICIAGSRFGRNFADDEISIVTDLSYQIATAFESARLNGQMERTYFETMTALALAVEARDPYSRGHSERVGEYAVRLGEAMGVDSGALQTLRDASRLHDIGKIGITDTILIKPAPLTEDERTTMKKHPLIGEGIVMPLKTFQHLLDPIRHHHECLDGTGYPDGLTGERIPLVTRIMAVADIYDALTSDRPYRKSLGPEGARRELDVLVSKGRIDEGVVEVLYRLIDLHDFPGAPAAVGRTAVTVN